MQTNGNKHRQLVESTFTYAYYSLTVHGQTQRIARERMPVLFLGVVRRAIHSAKQSTIKPFSTIAVLSSLAARWPRLAMSHEYALFCEI